MLCCLRRWPNPSHTYTPQPVCMTAVGVHQTKVSGVTIASVQVLIKTCGLWVVEVGLDFCRGTNCGHERWVMGADAGLPITTDSASDSSLGATRPTFVHWGSFSGGRVGSHRTGSLLWGQRLAQLFYHTGPDPGDQTHTRCQTPIGDEQPPLASRASGDDSGADRTHQPPCGGNPPN